MLERTHIPEAPWWVVEAVDKKCARLDCIAHLLTRIPYDEMPHEKPPCPSACTTPSTTASRPRPNGRPDHYAIIAPDKAKERGLQTANVGD